MYPSVRSPLAMRPILLQRHHHYYNLSSIYWPSKKVRPVLSLLQASHRKACFLWQRD